MVAVGLFLWSIWMETRLKYRLLVALLRIIVKNYHLNSMKDILGFVK